MVQILELTQKQIMADIKKLVDSKHWGDPKNFDIVIMRSGSGRHRILRPGRAGQSPLSPEVLDEYSKLNINLEALFDGGDPFASKLVESEAVDGQGYTEPAIQVDEAPARPEPPVPARYGTVPPQFRP
jgi:hypothetical protein